MRKLYLVLRVKLLLRKSRIIDSIKLVRQAYDWGLMDSKRFVTDIRDGHYPDSRDYPRI